MPELTPEQKARQQIDAMLKVSGWVVQDYQAFNPTVGPGVALREVPLKSGRCDYLLLVDRKAVGVVEAKKQGTTLADLVALVRFTLEQQPVLAPFADSVAERFNEWLMDKAKAGVTFQPEQLAWLNLIRDHIATSLSIEPDDFDYAPFSQRGGLGKAHQLFGEKLVPLLEELNDTLAA